MASNTLPNLASNNIYSMGSVNLNKAPAGSTSMGVQAKQPTAPTPTYSLPANQQKVQDPVLIAFNQDKVGNNAMKAQNSYPGATQMQTQPQQSSGFSGFNGGQSGGGGATSTFSTSFPNANPIGSTTSSTPAPAQATTTSMPVGNQTTSSIVDYLKSIGRPDDFNSRQGLAKQVGIQNYTGTAEQNIQLLNSLKNGYNEGKANNGSLSQNTGQIQLPGQTAGTPGQNQSQNSYNSSNTLNLPSNFATNTPQGLTPGLEALRKIGSQTTGGGNSAQSNYNSSVNPVVNINQNSGATGGTSQSSTGQVDPFTTYVQQLAKQAQMTDAERALMQQQAQLTENKATVAKNMGDVGDLYQSTYNGRMGLLNQAAQAQQQNLAEQTQTYTAQRQAAKDALSAAAGLTQPTSVPFSSGLRNPVTGELVGGSGAGGQFGDYVNYLQAQNAAQQGNQFANQASSSSLGLQQVRNLANGFADFAEKTGLAQNFFGNANMKLKDIESQLNPSNVATYANIKNGILSAYQNILIGRGIGVESATQYANDLNQNIDKMTGADLVAFLENLDIEAQKNIQPMQQFAQGAYGAASYGQPYLGSQVNPNQNYIPNFNNNVYANNAAPFTSAAAQAAGAAGVTNSVVNSPEAQGLLQALASLFMGRR